LEFIMPGTELLVVLLGLSSAFSWGAGDFAGGLASKRTSAYTVVVLSQFASLLILLAGVLLVIREQFSSQAAVMGGIAGISGAIGLTALYTGLARGPMGVVGPLTAVIAAVVPVVFTIFQSGLPQASDLLGILVALVAVWMISSGSSLGRVNLKDLALPLLGGIGFGLFFILIAGASGDTTVWPLIFARVSSVMLVFIVAVVLRRFDIPLVGQLPVILMAGIFDTGGSLLYILASRAGRLDIAAVLSSLYPAATVFLAYLLLKERLNRQQWFGVLLAILAVVLIAV
jgi:drug/metabolite transporter (DMT)-like permease